MKGKGTYPENWPELSKMVKAESGNCCERCRHPHEPKTGYALTVHHLDMDKSNNAKYNLAALCQRCHLHIQGRVNIFQTYMFPLSTWLKSHYEGFLSADKTKTE